MKKGISDLKGKFSNKNKGMNGNEFTPLQSTILKINQICTIEEISLFLVITLDFLKIFLNPLIKSGWFGQEN